MKNILVTGGAGFIGSNFIHYLLHQESDVRIINLDALTYAGSMENIKDLPSPERHLFIHGNITDRALLDQLLLSIRSIQWSTLRQSRTWIAPFSTQVSL